MRPVFDTCRVPLFLWNTYPYNYWETLTRSFAVLFSVYKEEWPVGGWVGGWVGDGGGQVGGLGVGCAVLNPTTRVWCLTPAGSPGSFPSRRTATSSFFSFDSMNVKLMTWPAGCSIFW